MNRFKGLLAFFVFLGHLRVCLKTGTCSSAFAGESYVFIVFLFPDSLNVIC